MRSTAQVKTAQASSNDQGRIRLLSDGSRIEIPSFDPYAQRYTGTTQSLTSVFVGPLGNILMVSEAYFKSYGLGVEALVYEGQNGMAEFVATKNCPFEDKDSPAHVLMSKPVFQHFDSLGDYMTPLCPHGPEMFLSVIQFENGTPIDTVMTQGTLSAFPKFNTRDYAVWYTHEGFIHLPSAWGMGPCYCVPAV